MACVGLRRSNFVSLLDYTCMVRHCIINVLTVHRAFGVGNFHVCFIFLKYSKNYTGCEISISPPFFWSFPIFSYFFKETSYSSYFLAIGANQIIKSNQYFHPFLFVCLLFLCLLFAVSTQKLGGLG